MTQSTQNITVREGEDKVIQISVKTQRVGGTAVNLTGSTITWVVTIGPESSAALISKTSTAGEITLDNDIGTNDRINIALDSADTQGLEGRDLYHECRVVDVAGDNSIVAVGSFKARHSATN